MGGGVVAQVPCIQKVNLTTDPKNKNPPPNGKFYAYVWTSDGESNYLKTILSDLAKHGLIVAVSKPIYREMKGQNLRKARTVVKDFTRHNDKLGFDFSVTNNGYYASYS